MIWIGQSVAMIRNGIMGCGILSTLSLFWQTDLSVKAEPSCWLFPRRVVTKYGDGIVSRHLQQYTMGLSFRKYTRTKVFFKRFYSPNNDNTWNCVCNLYYFGWRNPYLSLCFQLLIDMLHVRIYSTCGQHLSNQLGISSSIQWIPVTWTLDKVC